MPLTINTNTASLTAQRYLNLNTRLLNLSMEKLSSGFRINRSADDPAGLEIADKLRAQVRGAEAALGNVQDSINVLDIADSAMGVIGENLIRMKELAVQAGNDTLTTAQRTAIEEELDQLALEITRISDSTEYNTKKLLDGSTTAFVVQLGATNATSDRMDIATAAGSNPFADLDATALGVADASVAVDTAANAQTAIATIDTAINTLNTRRALVGGLTNRLEGAASYLEVNIENVTASESRIRNVDVAAESSNLIRYQILQQTTAAMLAQANQTPTLALTLLGL